MKPVLLIRSVAVALVVLSVVQIGLGRGLLWHTVQACVLDQTLLDDPAPCLAVEVGGGRRTGFVVLRSPLDASHAVLAPARRVVGIEARDLRAPDAANYIAESWTNRRFAFPAALQSLPVDEIGLAVNSQRGRTQDQLHVHIDCILPALKRSVREMAPRLQAGHWSWIEPIAGEQPYSITALGGDLQDTNVIGLAAAHLRLSEKEMPLLTLAVVAEPAAQGKARFFLLARKDLYRQHAELLLDHDCRDYLHRTGTSDGEGSISRASFQADTRRLPKK